MFPKTIKNFLWLLLILFVLAAIVYGVGLFNLKNEAAQSAQEIKKDFRSAASSITSLNIKSAKESFKQIYQQVLGLQTKTEDFYLNKFIKELPQTFNNLSELSLTAINLTDDLDNLKNNTFHWLMTQKGNLLVEKLKQINANLEKISPLIANLKQQATLINYPLSDDFVSINNQIYKSEQILKALIGWLTITEPQHLLILFQNQSEIRPTGGFLGSFADVGLKNGGLFNLEIRDIYDIDGQLEKNIVPPLALQTLTTRWGARDANWFFDFPTSARKVIELLEASKTYQEKETNFTGAIAINTKVLEDIIEIVGVIELPEYELTIDAENFLPLLQKEVEAGVDNKAGHPKTILQKLTPIIFERLGQLNENQKKGLIKKLGERLTNKDIQIYFEDLAIEAYLKDLGVAGEIVNLPADFNGDYLAVVNANIAGGKTDVLIKQKIRLESNISLSGKLENKLTIERNFSESPLDDPWYKKDNKDFVKILTLLNTSLISFPNAVEEPMKPIRDYQKLKYEADLGLEAAESPTAFGRQNFSGWIITKPGETESMSMKYENDRRIDFSKPFTFVYEKQSGVDSSLEYYISAPIGYKWKESNSPVFKYFTENTPAKLLLELHLIKN